MLIPTTKNQTETKNMSMENRKEFENEVVSRVINNTPVSELLRVYSLHLKDFLENLEDQDLLQSVLNAGYTDLIEKYTTPEEFFPVPDKG